MRITQNLFYGSTTKYTQQNLARIFEDQEQIASGIRIRKPSDDPGGVEQLLSYNRRLADLQQYSRNASQGRSFVESAASSLEGLSDLLASARENIIQALNGSISQPDRNTIVGELSGQLEDIVAIANTRVGSRYVFAGTASDTRPFTIETDEVNRQFVPYAGNSDQIVAQIGPASESALNIPGDFLFGTGRRGETNYEGITGAAAGTGADNGRGTELLSVYHTATNLASPSFGVALGASTAEDTVLGGIGTHSIFLETGTPPKISLNGGTAQNIDYTETDLRLEGPDGEVVHLDLTGVTPGTDVSLFLGGDGEISIDGGATRDPIDFTFNQQVRDASGETVLNVDGSGIRRAAEETLIYPGTLDLFDSLVAIKEGLASIGDNASNTNDLERLNFLLEEFDNGRDRVLESLGRLGTLSSRLESAESRLLDVEIQVKSLKADIEEVDIAEATSQLQRDETAYQTALLLTSRIGQLSLLNYI